MSGSGFPFVNSHRGQHFTQRRDRPRRARGHRRVLVLPPIREPSSSPRFFCHGLVLRAETQHPFPLLLLSFVLKGEKKTILAAPHEPLAGATVPFGALRDPRPWAQIWDPCSPDNIRMKTPGPAAPSHYPCVFLPPQALSPPLKPLVPSGAAPSGPLCALDLLPRFPADRPGPLSPGRTAPAATAIVPPLRSG